MAKRKSKKAEPAFSRAAYDTMALGFRSNYVYQSVLSGLEHEVNEMAAARGADPGRALELQDDLQRLAQYRGQYLTGERGVNVDHAIDLAIRIGARAQSLGIERLVQWETRRQARKQTADATRAATADAKAARAREMFKEWYLDVAKKERPKKKAVIADIARQLNKEFPSSPTKPRRVKDYLPSKNSAKD